MVVSEGRTEMITYPVTIILAGTVALGVVLGMNYLRDVRKPVLIGFHLLLGAGGLEQLLIALQGTPAWSLGVFAAGFLVLTLALGLVGGLIGRRSRRASLIMVGTHAAAGLTGVGLFLGWISGI
jgi:hypothetical protein